MNIVERLRAFTVGDQLYHPSICSEAAAEIERLRKLLDYATDTDAYRTLRSKNEQLRAEVELWKGRWESERADHERAIADLEWQDTRL